MSNYKIIELFNYSLLIIIYNTSIIIIKSVDMSFSSTSSSSSQSCILYFFKVDKTTIFGQSDPFNNNGAPWPGSAKVHVICPDIPYSGPFYAMVSYFSSASPIKNYFDVDTNSTFPNFPKGLAYVQDMNSISESFQ